MARNKGTYQFSSNFELRSRSPLDAKQLVGLKSDLIDPCTWTTELGGEWTYPGMIVGVGGDSESNNGIYFLKSSDYTNAGNWVKLDASGGGISGVLSVDSGGTGQSSLTPRKVLVGDGTTGIISASTLDWNESTGNLSIGPQVGNQRLFISEDNQITGFNTGSSTVNIQSKYSVDGGQVVATLKGLSVNANIDQDSSSSTSSSGSLTGLEVYSQHMGSLRMALGTVTGVFVGYTASGNLTNLYGLRMIGGMYPNTFGPIQNMYAIKIDEGYSQSSSIINKYAIHSHKSAGQSYFGEKIGIGILPTTSMLDVATHNSSSNTIAQRWCYDNSTASCLRFVQDVSGDIKKWKIDLVDNNIGYAYVTFDRTRIGVLTNKPKATVDIQGDALIQYDLSLGTPLKVTSGGTGINVLNPNSVLIGNGTNNVLSPSELYWNNSSKIFDMYAKVNIYDVSEHTIGSGGSIQLGGKYNDLGQYTEACIIKSYKESFTSGLRDFGLSFSTRTTGIGITNKMWITSQGKVIIANANINPAEGYSIDHRLIVDGSVRIIGNLNILSKSGINNIALDVSGGKGYFRHRVHIDDVWSNNMAPALTIGDTSNGLYYDAGEIYIHSPNIVHITAGYGGNNLSVSTTQINTQLPIISSKSNEAIDLVNGYFRMRPGAVNGYVLTCNSTGVATWQPAGAGDVSIGVSTFSAGTTGLTPDVVSTGAITLAGTLITSNGGTGLSSWSQGDIPYYNSGNTLSKLAKTTAARRVITNSGTNNNPMWRQLNIYDIDPSVDIHGALIYSEPDRGRLQALPIGPAGTVVTSKGDGYSPVYSEISKNYSFHTITDASSITIYPNSVHKINISNNNANLSLNLKSTSYIAVPTRAWESTIIMISDASHSNFKFYVGKGTEISSSVWMNGKLSSISPNKYYTIRITRLPGTSALDAIMEWSMAQGDVSANYLDVNTDRIVLGTASGQSDILSVYSNLASWTATESAAWFSINGSNTVNGSNNQNITVASTSYNNTGNWREASINITGGGITQVVTVLQAPEIGGQSVGGACAEGIMDACQCADYGDPNCANCQSSMYELLFDC